MNASLTVAIADGDVQALTALEKNLMTLGHRVRCATRTAHQLVEQCRQNCPELIIIDVTLADGDGISAAQAIYRNHPVAIVLTSELRTENLADLAAADHALAWLVKPISQDDLIPALALTMRQFHQLQQLRRQAADLQQELEAIAGP